MPKADKPKSYHVEQWQPPHWRGLLSTKDLERAITFAKEAGGKTRITEFPGAKLVWES